MDYFQITAAALLAVVATARVTRLIVHDTYPPAAWLRRQWDRVTKDGSWSELVHCHYCAAPYVAVANLAWGLLSDFHQWWWIVNAALALSYAAAILVSHDGDD